MDIKFLQAFLNEGQLTQAELDAVIPKFKQVEFKRNEFLANAGKTANDYWVLESGFIRSYVFDADGDEITTNFYSAGDVVIDWVSFLQRRPAREYIQALKDCICWQLDFDSFQTLFNTVEPFREQCRGRLVNGYFTLKERSISMITDQAKDRYARLLKDKPDIFQNASLKNIATFLGVTDTSLSRIRKEIVAG
ncbi:MAG: Crp/Fnr family transcriptional regulator [Tannerella sp.]|jgi:CRP-like cAMP-binding protein|nr:Crp/Fnr family transcriptional regulator [Tannerella sp.]